MLQEKQSPTLARDRIPGEQFKQLRTKDAGVFAALTESYRRELTAHCYRMMGSLQDAEDLVQETLLRAWQHLGTFDQPISFRAWLYKIATNVCLDALAKRPRRQLPTLVYPKSEVGQGIEPPASEVVPLWLEPYPDEWLAGVEANPEARYTMQESITLAFLAALQVLSPRQRAVLLLMDVLDWHAAEAAQLLEVSVAAVNSALHRGRAAMSKAYGGNELDGLRASPDDTATEGLLNRYMRAWEEADIETLVSMLRKDAMVSMPPLPNWYRGRAAIRAFMSGTFFEEGASGRWKFLATRANAQPAAGLYMRDDAIGMYRPFTLHLVSVQAGRVANVVSFVHPALFSRFGLPGQLSE